MANVRAGPDFMCIGLQKARTGWLYDQLQFHPDFWMTPVKEISYFNGRFPHDAVKESAASALSDRQAYNAAQARRNWQTIDERGEYFFRTAMSVEGQKKTLGTYASLFREKGAYLSGDITPGYSKLKSPLIKRISRYFPHLRVIMLVRDPVSRAMSQILMHHRKERVSELDLGDLDALKAKFLTRSFLPLSFPSQVAGRWREHFPDERFQVFFFEDIIGRPAEVRREILEYVGADPAKPSGAFEPGYNRKRNQRKSDYEAQLVPDIEAFLVEFFAEELHACAETFGGHAREWPARYGL